MIPFFAPVGITEITFLCVGAGAFTASFTCKTKGLSGQWNSSTQFGVMGHATAITMGIDASNFIITLAFSTTDSNGGTSTWSAKY